MWWSGGAGEVPELLCGGSTHVRSTAKRRPTKPTPAITRPYIRTGVGLELRAAAHYVVVGAHVLLPRHARADVLRLEALHEGRLHRHVPLRVVLFLFWGVCVGMGSLSLAGSFGLGRCWSLVDTDDHTPPHHHPTTQHLVCTCCGMVSTMGSSRPSIHAVAVKKSTLALAPPVLASGSLSWITNWFHL